MDAGIGISVRLLFENTLFKTVVHPGTPIRLRFSRSSELMCSVLSHCKAASNRVTALLQPNKHARHSVLDRKLPKDSNFASSGVRFVSVGCIRSLSGPTRAPSSGSTRAPSRVITLGVFVWDPGFLCEADFISFFFLLTLLGQLR